MLTNLQYSFHSVDGTRAVQMERVLADGAWHSTRELVRRVGHTFAGAKFQLVAEGYTIERRRHPLRGREYQYRMSGYRKTSRIEPCCPLRPPIRSQQRTGN